MWQIWLILQNLPLQICNIKTDIVPCTHDGDHRCGDDNQCIRPIRICDGESFCRDGSDEANCDGMTIKLFMC